MADVIDIVVRDRIQASISRNLLAIGNSAATAQTRLERLRRAMNLSSGGFRTFTSNSARAVSGLKKLESGIANTAQKFRTFASGLLLIGATGGIASQIDSYRQLQNQLRGVTDTQQQLNTVTEKIFDIAQRARVPIDDLGTSYRRFDIALKAAGRSQQESLDVTETIAKAITLSGATASESASALLQLSQAFNKGKLDGDEFRSTAENIPAILDALSVALGESRTKLFDLSRSGKININILLEAFKALKLNVDKEFTDLPRTATQGFTQLFNAIKFEFGRFAESSGAIDTLNAAFDKLRLNLDVVGRLLLSMGVSIGVILATGLAVWLASLVGPLATLGTAVVALIGYFTFFADKIHVAGEGSATLSSTIRVLIEDLGRLVASGDIFGDLFTVEGAQRNLDLLIAGLDKLRYAFNVSVASIAGLKASLDNLFSETGELGKMIRFTKNAIILGGVFQTILPNAIKTFGNAFKVLEQITERTLVSLVERAKATMNAILTIARATANALPGGDALTGSIDASKSILNGISGKGVVDAAKKAGALLGDEFNEGLALSVESNSAGYETAVENLIKSIDETLVKDNPLFKGFDEVEANAKSSADVFREAYQNTYNTIKPLEDDYLESVKARALAIDQAAKAAKAAVLPTSDESLRLQDRKRMLEFTKELAEQNKKAADSGKDVGVKTGESIDAALPKVQGFGNAFNDLDRQVKGFGNSVKQTQEPLTVVGEVAKATSEKAKLIGENFDAAALKSVLAITKLADASEVDFAAIVTKSREATTQFSQSFKVAAIVMSVSMQTATTKILQNLNLIDIKVLDTSNQLKGNFAAGADRAARSVTEMKNSMVADLNQLQRELAYTNLLMSGGFSSSKSSRKAMPGFATGGYTGDGSPNQVAGYVHRKEFVMPAEQTAKYRPVLESMRSGGRSASTSSNDASVGNSSGVKVYIENYGSSTHTVEQLSPNEVRIIARETLQREAGGFMAQALSNPNSEVSKSLQANTRAKRRR